MTKQVKSKQRVADHGEVFTAEREVKAMCDLVAAQCDNVDATFLEPACGNGNFLSEILSRKLNRVKKDAKNDHVMWEWLSVRAIASLYGVDILLDNCEECRGRLFKQWNAAYKSACGKDCNDETRQSVRYILDKNIVCGNALTMMCVDENGQDTDRFITFAEFKTCGRQYMLKRRDYRLDVLLKENPDEGKQGSSDMFSTSGGTENCKPARTYEPKP